MNVICKWLLAKRGNPKQPGHSVFDVTGSCQNIIYRREKYKLPGRRPTKLEIKPDRLEGVVTSRLISIHAPLLPVNPRSFPTRSAQPRGMGITHEQSFWERSASLGPWERFQVSRLRRGQTLAYYYPRKVGAIVIVCCGNGGSHSRLRRGRSFLFSPPGQLNLISYAFKRLATMTVCYNFVPCQVIL